MQTDYGKAGDSPSSRFDQAPREKKTPAKKAAKKAAAKK